VPLKVITCGLPLALSLKLIVAVRKPAACGANARLTAHVAPEATVALKQLSNVVKKSL
jgi:hypothetical protein